MRLLLILALAMFFLNACTTKGKCEMQKNCKCDSMEEYKMYEWPETLSFELEPGTAERFILGENGTTGYLWNAEFDKKACKVVLERLPFKGDDRLCGAPGKVMVSIEPLVKGESDITLKYMRSWEPESPAHTINVHLKAK